MNPKLKEALKWLGATAVIVVAFRLIGIFVELYFTGHYR